MSRSGMLRQADAIRLLEIVGEMHELPNDLTVRAGHLAARLADLVGAQFALFSVTDNLSPTTVPRLRFSVEGGFLEGKSRSILLRYLEEGDHAADPALSGFAKRMTAPGRAVFSREALVSDRDWYLSRHVMEYRRAGGIDSCIYAGWRLDEVGTFVGIGFHRPWGERSFGQREQTIIETINSSLGWFYRAAEQQASTPPAEAAVRLTPTIRATLALLLKGLSEKQIAFQRRLSRHSVHDHVKFIYRHYCVSSRAELLARCAGVQF